MKAYIKRISYYLPPKILSNEKLVEEFPEWTVDKIALKVGVNNRHVAGEQETALDMAVAAANNLFVADSDIQREDVDFVLFCTQSPDYFLPTSACLIQEQLGLRTNIGAIDYNLGCSGYVYGLAIAKGLIIGGIAKNVLLLTAETYSKFLHPRDKGNRTIFGDAASASIISTEGFAEIGEFALGTDGKGANNLIVRTGASREKEAKNDLSFDENGNPVSSDYLHMNGAEIFTFTQKNVPVVVKDTLLKNNLEQPEIDLFVLHQANKYMLNFLRKKMKIEEEKFYYFLSEVGNTVSNSIPLALYEAKRENRLNGNVLLAGFGVGYSWAGVVLKA
ncbi:ketoacyl-ACP synthase III [Parabacteroides faecis]|uniref:3-oxoacyl-ACP synthase III family protein n=1 Tax=Parabacteroides TaxID=375288 RepID=UPI000EFDD2C6|nr:MULTISPECIES: ketoacyl-ACP synthase III [Parabacteroides]MBC8617559.1 ketoacyl-ACP synthase III [Parabacteroides faecis]RHR99564.1 ketoacyl-ACP synthase III [Parabacteroides sp. AF14-59]